jgi:carbamoyltransferase
MAPHDAGLSLGGALWADYLLNGTRPEYPVSPYLGPSFSEKSVNGSLGPHKARSSRPKNLENTVAEALASGQVVGWFHGRAEYGARALGARSVLADPRNPNAKARLNQLMKRRDWFMPFAPSILEEFGEDYFEDFRPSPYMNIAFKVRSDKRSEICGAIHADGTCRAHTVSRQLNPKFHSLITEFHRIAGVPLVLNTSFNRHGVPMVCTPKDALDHLNQGCVDILAIEGFLVAGGTDPVLEGTVPDSVFEEFEIVRHAVVLAKQGKLERARELLQKRKFKIVITDQELVDQFGDVWSYKQPIEYLQKWYFARHKQICE